MTPEKRELCEQHIERLDRNITEIKAELQEPPPAVLPLPGYKSFMALALLPLVKAFHHG